MTIPVTRTGFDVSAIMAVQGEAGVICVTLTLPRYRGELDLADMVFTMQGAVEGCAVKTVLTEKTVSAREIALCWPVTADWTARAGYVDLTLTAARGGTVVKWRGDGMLVTPDPLAAHTPAAQPGTPQTAALLSEIEALKQAVLTLSQAHAAATAGRDGLCSRMAAVEQTVRRVHRRLDTLQARPRG